MACRRTSKCVERVRVIPLLIASTTPTSLVLSTQLPKNGSREERGLNGEGLAEFGDTRILFDVAFRIHAIFQFDWAGVNGFKLCKGGVVRASASATSWVPLRVAFVRAEIVALGASKSLSRHDISTME